MARGLSHMALSQCGGLVLQRQQETPQSATTVLCSVTYAREQYLVIFTGAAHTQGEEILQSVPIRRSELWGHRRVLSTSQCCELNKISVAPDPRQAQDTCCSVRGRKITWEGRFG